MTQSDAVSTLKAMIYLSDRRTMYIGQLKRMIDQSNGLTVLIISLGEELALIDSNGVQQGVSKSFLIPAGAHVSLDTRDSIIVWCFLDTIGQDLATLIPNMASSMSIDDHSDCYCGIANEAQLIKQALSIFTARASAQEAFSLLDRWLAFDAEDIVGFETTGTVGTPFVPDKRVEMAISLIKKNYSENLSIDEIAGAVELSVPRLIQLFKQTTGIPIRRFRLCHRIYVTLINLSKGMVLTEAVLDAGFSDYAHFSRIFKELSSVKPSKILSSKNIVDFRVLPD